jgi:hypothetical protein
MATTFTVEVTEEDLMQGAGRIGQATGDPIYLAVQRLFPTLGVMVMPAVIVLNSPGLKDRWFALPQVAREFITLYDQGKWEELEPFSFEIEETVFNPSSGPTVVHRDLMHAVTAPLITRRVR